MRVYSSVSTRTFQSPEKVVDGDTVYQELRERIKGIGNLSNTKFSPARKSDFIPNTRLIQKSKCNIQVPPTSSDNGHSIIYQIPYSKPIKPVSVLGKDHPLLIDVIYENWPLTLQGSGAEDPCCHNLEAIERNHTAGSLKPLILSPKPRMSLPPTTPIPRSKLFPYPNNILNDLPDQSSSIDSNAQCYAPASDQVSDSLSVGEDAKSYHRKRECQITAPTTPRAGNGSRRRYEQSVEELMGGIRNVEFFQDSSKESVTYVTKSKVRLIDQSEKMALASLQALSKVPFRLETKVRGAIKRLATHMAASGGSGETGSTVGSESLVNSGAGHSVPEPDYRLSLEGLLVNDRSGPLGIFSGPGYDIPDDACTPHSRDGMDYTNSDPDLKSECLTQSNLSFDRNGENIVKRFSSFFAKEGQFVKNLLDNLGDNIHKISGIEVANNEPMTADSFDISQKKKKKKKTANKRKEFHAAILHSDDVILQSFVPSEISKNATVTDELASDSDVSWQTDWDDEVESSEILSNTDIYVTTLSKCPQMPLTHPEIDHNRFVRPLEVRSGVIDESFEGGTIMPTINSNDSADTVITTGENAVLSPKSGVSNVGLSNNRGDVVFKTKNFSALFSTLSFRNNKINKEKPIYKSQSISDPFKTKLSQLFDTKNMNNTHTPSKLDCSSFGNLNKSQSEISYSEDLNKSDLRRSLLPIPEGESYTVSSSSKMPSSKDLVMANKTFGSMLNVSHKEDVTEHHRPILLATPKDDIYSNRSMALITANNSNNNDNDSHMYSDYVSLAHKTDGRKKGTKMRSGSFWNTINAFQGRKMNHKNIAKKSVVPPEHGECLSPSAFFFSPETLSIIGSRLENRTGTDLPADAEATAACQLVKGHECQNGEVPNGQVPYHSYVNLPTYVNGWGHTGLHPHYYNVARAMPNTPITTLTPDIVYYPSTCVPSRKGPNQVNPYYHYIYDRGTNFNPSPEKMKKNFPNDLCQMVYHHYYNCQNCHETWRDANNDTDGDGDLLSKSYDNQRLQYIQEQNDANSANRCNSHMPGNLSIHCNGALNKTLCPFERPGRVFKGITKGRRNVNADVVDKDSSCPVSPELLKDDQQNQVETEKDSAISELSDTNSNNSNPPNGTHTPIANLKWNESRHCNGSAGGSTRINILSHPFQQHIPQIGPERWECRSSNCRSPLPPHQTTIPETVDWKRVSEQAASLTFMMQRTHKVIPDDKSVKGLKWDDPSKSTIGEGGHLEINKNGPYMSQPCGLSHPNTPPFLCNRDNQSCNSAFYSHYDPRPNPYGPYHPNHRLPPQSYYNDKCLNGTREPKLVWSGQPLTVITNKERVYPFTGIDSISGIDQSLKAMLSQRKGSSYGFRRSDSFRRSSGRRGSARKVPFSPLNATTSYRNHTVSVAGSKGIKGDLCNSNRGLQGCADGSNNGGSSCSKTNTTKKWFTAARSRRSGRFRKNRKGKELSKLEDLFSVPTTNPKPDPSDVTRSSSSLMSETIHAPDDGFYYDPSIVSLEASSSSGSRHSSSHSAHSTKTFWHALPEVVNSLLLAKMTSSEIQLQEALYEIISSEKSYLKSLNTLVDHFYYCSEFVAPKEGSKQTAILSQQEKHYLFSNLTAVRAASRKLVNDLGERWLRDGLVINDICDIIINHCLSGEHGLEVYIKYCTNQSYQFRALKYLKENNTNFLKVLKGLEKSEKCQGLSMYSYLILPMQRITRLPLLIKSVYEKREPDTSEHLTAKQALQLLNNIVSRCNSGARSMERVEQLIYISRNLKFKVKKIPIVSKARHLIKQGDLICLSCSTANLPPTYSNNKAKVIKLRIHLILFNDLLLITKRRGSSYDVNDYCPRDLVDIRNTDESDSIYSLSASCSTLSQNRNLFVLIMLKNHENKFYQLVLECLSNAELEEWVTALKNPDFQYESI